MSVKHSIVVSHKDSDKFDKYFFDTRKEAMDFGESLRGKVHNCIVWHDVFFNQELAASSVLFSDYSK